jgi:hypothetical protein
MSQPVDLDALGERLAEYGPSAFLVTVNEDGTPHVVSVEVRYADQQFTMSVGRSSRKNAGRTSELTLLWPSGPDPAYSMIVDVTFVGAEGEDGPITVAPHAAILHRIAGAAGDGPTCVRLEEARPGE